MLREDLQRCDSVLAEEPHRHEGLTANAPYLDPESVKIVTSGRIKNAPQIHKGATSFRVLAVEEGLTLPRPTSGRLDDRMILRPAFFVHHAAPTSTAHT
jgi:hypothetical protein